MFAIHLTTALREKKELKLLKVFKKLAEGICGTDPPQKFHFSHWFISVITAIS